MGNNRQSQTHKIDISHQKMHIFYFMRSSNSHHSKSKKRFTNIMVLNKKERQLSNQSIF